MLLAAEPPDVAPIVSLVICHKTRGLDVGPLDLIRKRSPGAKENPRNNKRMTTFQDIAYRWLEASVESLAPRSVKHFLWLLESYVFPPESLFIMLKLNIDKSLLPSIIN